MLPVLKTDKKEQEQRLITKMVEMYRSFKGREINDDELDELLLYAFKRSESCLYRKNGEKKPFCNVCPVHCYKKDMREKIKKIMRYAGPRLLFKHPILSLDHLFKTIYSKKHPPQPPMRSN
ncbi:nitrous oxide-stimulated promoter family protein [Treponema sp. OMZ 792]|uniref:nitrous oxide-stimulated promoter family protein n=1 Tax=unclassified Treponema TaxID=2638727 RepID=UPI0020A3443F|nr:MULTISPECIES: nitrous oxide-stimulated promoter family protein [unclassified Treponema]UTC63893.1 nitrous oxide-stimulated promoter family protein [Treponema sp. OMZ 788]UTC74256.1 nitrous oxide-stimulated promoter family protein [Treponema sp. OMZ 792]UTC80653.1 nitrous oxide-stimulated promoter family protein [Treponema sp. OMZ 798]